MNVYPENDYRNYLEHHGILGMKWGVRRSDTYPLKPSEHSASEKKAGWRKSLDGGSKQKGNTKSGDGQSKVDRFKGALDSAKEKLSDPKTQRALKIAAVVGATALTAYAGSRVIQSAALKKAAAERIKHLGDNPEKLKKANAVFDAAKDQLERTAKESFNSEAHGVASDNYFKSFDNVIKLESKINQVNAKYDHIESYITGRNQGLMEHVIRGGPNLKRGNGLGDKIMKELYSTTRSAKYLMKRSK